MTEGGQPAGPEGPWVPGPTTAPGPPATPPFGPPPYGAPPGGPGAVGPAPRRRKAPGTGAVVAVVVVAFVVVAVTAAGAVAFVLGRDTEEAVVEVLTPDEITSTCALDGPTDPAGDPLTLEPSRALDGDPATSWTCRADGSTMAMTMTWADPIEVTEVGLLPGLDLFGPGNGADRWVQNRRVERVRWSFDDEEVDQDFDVEERTVQTVAVETTTTTITLEVLATVPGREIVDDEGTTRAAAEDVPIGEVEVRGVR